MLELKFEVCGFFKLEAIKPDGSKRIVADWFPNLITNNGLNLLATSSATFSYCHVGSGSTDPAVTDTQLTTFIAGVLFKSSSSAVQAISPYYTALIRVYSFNAGVADGNLSEIGIGFTSTTGNLFSRALILDGAGNPTTITILPDEVLDVTYECRIYVPETDILGTIVLNSISYDWTSRASLAGTLSWSITTIQTAASITVCDAPIGLITTSPAGSASLGTDTTAAYIADSHYVDVTVTWGLTLGNFTGGIDSVFGSIGSAWYQIGFSPAIPKTSSDTLTLVIRHSWGRKTI
jgi:hypothetical protein